MIAAEPSHLPFVAGLFVDTRRSQHKGIPAGQIGRHLPRRRERSLSQDTPIDATESLAVRERHARRGRVPKSWVLFDRVDGDFLLLHDTSFDQYSSGDSGLLCRANL
ncbi:hypothetical protein RSSM_01037 [Rhodopirellula sallentina SM41]|uniref:Uncharacterized protein n=1 Tax=Rhodopirellula sallentina SM41 TaxID=1263870 RepID=M5UNA1_9BACT|nr:hypothetical protein RSSM_01037 [Rhodopirellula sallentina SM41]